MSLGDYPDRIRIEQRVVTSRSATGADNYGWVLFKPRWAKYTPISGKEILAGQQIQAEIVASFRMYHTNTILPEMRIVFRGVPYDIHSIIDTGGRREELEIMTMTGATNG